MSKSHQGSKRTTGADRSSDRHRCATKIFTRQPPAVCEAMNRIAEKRNTTVAAMLGEAAFKIIEDARDELPQKLQRKLRNLSAARPPKGRPRSKAARLQQ